MSASVILTFPKKCEGILRIMNVELREQTFYGEMSPNAEFSFDKYAPYDNLHSKSAEFAADVQKYDLR